jgi:NADPH-dependent 2,4-dienoyl-CoA reductase/sulfur reductase-like enzyme/peroxiredoxin family protein/TusA-related sulfurtransferase/rhodanese-related sulfurtransferase
MNRKVLIVGGVAGGASTATRLRRLDESAHIIMFERGKYISYANCGLPYYIGGTIKERESLIVASPQKITGHFNIDLRTEQEVIAIDKENKNVQVKNLITQEEYVESYDTLVLSTGSSPIKPSIEGINSPGIFTLWTIPDTDQVKSYITEKQPKKAAVIGGGFIGLEMAENLHDAGLDVTLVEMLDQVMPPVDYEMARLLQDNMDLNGVVLKLGSGVQKFEQTDNGILIHLQNGDTVAADMVILSIGVQPNSELAQNAGLALNERGGIKVDAHMRTSAPDIYAVGDVVEIDEFISKNKAMIPLAGPANKQARICANNIAADDGKLESYNGTQGTCVAKVFDLTVAVTGVNEKTLQRWGKQYGKDYHSVVISQKSHAGYYPGAAAMILKLIFDNTGKIYGAQIVGQEGVDKRIDTIAATIRQKGDIYALKELELAYAPPYSSAKDPVNMLGFVAENVLNGLASFVRYDELDATGKYWGKEDHIVLDVGEDAERMMFSMEGSVHIPLGKLRERIDELDKDKLIIVYCAIGVRSYNGARILMQKGFKNVKIYPAGTSFFKALHYDTRKSDHQEAVKNVEETHTNDVPNIKVSFTVDCSGMQCPGPIMKVFETIKDLMEGDVVEVTATDFGFGRDVEAWCKRTGNTFIKAEKRNNQIVAYIQKGMKGELQKQQEGPVSVETSQGKTIIVFSGDLDKIIAAFIIANGAAAMGRPVTLFFTFWGLNALRKKKRQSVKKSFLDRMFGEMMPRGLGKLRLSKLNMMGMGTVMMKKVMRDKNVESLDVLVKKAMENGVKLIACTMSMDIMGITKEELIDGIDFAGVGTYLGEAEESNVNLFI